MDQKTRVNVAYLERLVELIPAEIVAAHLAVQGLVANHIDFRNLGLEISAGVLLMVLPLYLRRIHGVDSWLKVLLTMGSFIVWVCAVSSPVYRRWILDPIWCSIALILWTTIMPVLNIEKSHDK